MIREPKTLDKFPDEERVFAFDFSKQPDMPDITAAEINISPVTTPPLTVGQALVVNLTVKAEFQGGKVGSVYLIECLANTSQGARVAQYGKLEIADPAEWAEA